MFIYLLFFFLVKFFSSVLSCPAGSLTSLGYLFQTHIVGGRLFVQLVNEGMEGVEGVEGVERVPTTGVAPIK